MKNFNYTARDSSGSTKRGSLKAIDRNAALHELAAQGMVPLSVTEGVAQPGGGTIKPIYAITAGIAALLIIGVAVMVLYQGSSTPKPSGKKGSSTKTPSSVYTQRNKKAVSTKVPVAATNTPISSAHVTNAIVSSVTNKPIDVGTAGTPVAATNTPPRKMFSTGVEQVINMIANTRPGSPVPPLPRLHLKENVVDILNRDIVLYEEDNELTAEKKANVAHAKQLMKDYIAQGGKPEEFLAFFHGELKKAHTEWREAQVQAISLFKGDDQEAAQKYFEETNRKFAGKGMKPISKPGGIQ